MTLNRKLLFFVISIVLSQYNIQANTYTADSKLSFETIAPTLVAGDTLIILNGTYNNWGEVRIDNLQGTASNPIVIKAESLYGAVFTGDLWLRFLEADYLVLEGFKFTQISETFDRTLNLQECNNSKVRRCSFINIINTSGPYKAILRFDYGFIVDANTPEKNTNNIVEYCLFENLQACQALQIQLGDFDTNVGQNIIRNNVFRDTDAILENGGEAIQLLAGVPQNDRPGNNIVEGNVFDNWNGDPETISVKSGRNTIRNNVFANYTDRGSLTLRRETGNVVEQNYFYNGITGVWAFGADHIIRNNLFLDMIDEAIRLNAEGSSGSVAFEISENNLVANNSIINSKRFGITFLSDATNFNGERAKNNRIINNVFTIESEDVNRSFFRTFPGNIGGEEANNAIENNLYFSNTVTTPDLSGNNINQDPQLNADQYRTFATTSPVIDAGQNLSEVTIDFFGKSRTGTHIGHTTHPLDTAIYLSPLMFFPPDVTTFSTLSAEANYASFSRDWKTGSVVMLDARTSKGFFDKYRWVITSSQGSIDSGPIDESIYSLIYDEALEYEVTLELLNDNGTVLSTTSTILTEPNREVGELNIRPYNVLTPNGDGQNDTWQIENFDSITNEDYNIKVFTKTGQIVFETDNYNQDWAGTNQSREPLIEGVYYYIISVEGIEDVKTGYITLVK